MRFRLACLSLITAIVSAGQAFAHPGHAVDIGDSHTLSHYVTHPDHLPAWVLIAAVVFAGVLCIRTLVIRSTKKRLTPAYARARKPVQ